MLLLSLYCIALLVTLGLILGPLMLLDDHLERRRARLEQAALGDLTDPVTVPAPRAPGQTSAITHAQ